VCYQFPLQCRPTDVIQGRRSNTPLILSSTMVYLHVFPCIISNCGTWSLLYRPFISLSLSRDLVCPQTVCRFRRARYSSSKACCCSSHCCLVGSQALVRDTSTHCMASNLQSMVVYEGGSKVNVLFVLCTSTTADDQHLMHVKCIHDLYSLLGYILYYLSTLLYLLGLTN
jgi:hypothetical protein